MISFLSSVVTNPYFLAVTGTVAALVLITRVAIPIIKKSGEIIRESALYTNLKSMFCNKCASLHRAHSENNNIEKIDYTLLNSPTANAYKTQSSANLTTATLMSGQ